MDWKKLGKTILFPPTGVMAALILPAVGLLVYSMVFVGTESALAIISYVLAAYVLTIWCIRIPRFIRAIKTFKRENKYAVRWFSDEKLRVKVSLYASLIWNAAYAALQMGMGLYHGSFWFWSMAIYYVLLASLRYWLVRYTTKHMPGQNMQEELIRYRNCGITFLGMNLMLAVMIFFMVYWNRTFHHHEITTIAMAAYTFTAFSFAIRDIVKYRKYNSPVYSAAKATSLAAACVSMMTLESTMLTTFGSKTMDTTSKQIMLGISGGAISVFIVAMAIYMIIRSNKKLKELKNKEG